MTIQTSYPVFESGQVLTSGHLNDLVEYLEQQDRLTRNKLIGIGIVCGLEPCYEATENRIRLSGGCAVTSKGYLIVVEECRLDRVLPYTLPVPSLEEATADQIEEARYRFFHDGDGDQIELWELYADDYTPPPGEPEPTPINAADLTNMVLLLYLECNLESLKSCDINDCSDKGAEMEFTLRKLLVRQTDADAILAKEQNEADRPVNRSAHPRYELDPLQIEKINPAAHGLVHLDELANRILEIVAEVTASISTASAAAYEAYRHLLADMYPSSVFPNGPFGNTGYLEQVFTRFSANIFMVQYLYDYFRDVVQSHNEFIAEACRLDAECCPSDARFPKHALAGVIAETPAAFATTLDQPSEALAFDPPSAQSGFGPGTRPAPYRHHFIPSELHDRASERLAWVRSLHYRTYLLAYRYDTRDLEDADIRITPSKEGDATLTNKAIPFWYEFETGDDLHRNWSFPKTVKNGLEQVYSYQFTGPFTDTADHPLRLRLDDHDFYRIEGIVGKPLGSTMDELIRQKRSLGLSFGIEPVYIGLGADESERELDGDARATAAQVILRLLLCRMRDLDVVFLVLMAALFFYLYYILSQLARVRMTSYTAFARDARPARDARDTVTTRLPQVTRRVNFDRKVTERVLDELRLTTYVKGTVTDRITVEAQTEDVLGNFYARVRNTSSTDNLFDRTVAAVKEMRLDIPDEVVVTELYPAMSLVENTETLVDIVSAKSIADFDFDAFDRKYVDFTRSYESYITNARRVETEPDSDLAVANENIVSTYGAVAANGARTVVGNLATELQSRIATIFGELLLPGYAQRHPGMLHKAGTPRGGTFILLYTHRESILGVINRRRSRIESSLAETLGRFLAPGWTLTLGDPNGMLGPVGAPDDEPLDEFVVVADFCVPYLCCDSDCSEIEIAGQGQQEDEEEEEETQEPGVVRGRVIDRETGERVVNADVTATHPDSGAIAFSAENGNFLFTSDPGLVAVTAASPDHRTNTETVEVESRGAHVLVIELGRRREEVERVAASIRVVFAVGGVERPIRNARIRLRHTDGEEPEVSETADRYLFKGPVGRYTVRVTASGFEERTTEIEVTAQSLEHTITLIRQG